MVGTPAWVLSAANTAGCAAVAWLGWLYWALSHSEGTGDPNASYLVLGLALLVCSVGTMILLARRRRLLAGVFLAAEFATGVAILLQGLDASVHSDQWLLVTAFAIGLTGVRAIAAAQYSPR